MYRTGQIDCGPAPWWSVRQADLESLKKSHPHLLYRDFQSIVTGGITMRTDQSPFNDVRVRRAISHALDRQGLIEAVSLRGEATPAIGRGLAEWSLSVDQLGAGAKYYQYDPKEARRLLTEAGYAKGFKTQLTATSGLGRDLVDAAQLVQGYLKDVGIEAELKLQEYGAYMATTNQGKYEGMGVWAHHWRPGPRWPVVWEVHPDHLLNRAMSNDPKITAMLKEQRRTKDLEARKKIIMNFQRYEAEQQYYVYANSNMLTGSWQPYVKNYAPTRASTTAVVWPPCGWIGRERRKPSSMTRTTWCLVGLVGLGVLLLLIAWSFRTMLPYGVGAGGPLPLGNRRYHRKRAMVTGPNVAGNAQRTGYKPAGPLPTGQVTVAVLSVGPASSPRPCGWR